MTTQLAKNASKGGWHSTDSSMLFDLLEEKVETLYWEMLTPIHTNKTVEQHRKEIQTLCADISNYAMMIADVSTHIQ